MKILPLGIVGMSLTTLLSLSSCKEPAPSVIMPKPIAEVSIITVSTKAIIKTTELPGRISPYRISEIRPQVDGIILERLFDEGSDVYQDQALYQIDNAKYKASLDSAQANLARSQALAATARIKFERYQQLIKTNAVSRQDYDDVVSNLKTSEADVMSYRAAVDLAKLNLNYATVKSPIAGRIGKSNVTEGALVTTNQQQALTVVQQLNPIYVDISQPSIDILRLKQDLQNGKIKSFDNQKARITLIMEDGEAYPHFGTLQFADTTVEQATGSVTVRAIFPNPNNDLLPGTYVRATLEQANLENAILIPQQSVSRDRMGNTVVMVVDQHNKVEARPIVTQKAIHNQWLVTSGLKSGEHIIVEGLQKVKPNDTVKTIIVSQPPAPVSQDIHTHLQS